MTFLTSEFVVYRIPIPVSPDITNFIRTTLPKIKPIDVRTYIEHVATLDYRQSNTTFFFGENDMLRMYVHVCAYVCVFVYAFLRYK